MGQTGVWQEWDMLTGFSCNILLSPSCNFKKNFRQFHIAAIKLSPHTKHLPTLLTASQSPSPTLSPYHIKSHLSCLLSPLPITTSLLSLLTFYLSSSHITIILLPALPNLQASTQQPYAAFYCKNMTIKHGSCLLSKCLLRAEDLILNSAGFVF